MSLAQSKSNLRIDGTIVGIVGRLADRFRPFLLLVNLRNGNTWEVEDFGVFPARLMGLRSSGRVVPQ